MLNSKLKDPHPFWSRTHHLGTKALKQSWSFCMLSTWCLELQDLQWYAEFLLHIKKTATNVLLRRLSFKFDLSAIHHNPVVQRDRSCNRLFILCLLYTVLYTIGNRFHSSSNYSSKCSGSTGFGNNIWMSKDSSIRVQHSSIKYVSDDFCTDNLLHNTFLSILLAD